MDEFTNQDANNAILNRYLDLLEAARGDDPMAPHPRLSIDNLIWMSKEIIGDGATMPVDKTGRWMGFIQGCMAMRGLICVDEEREITRPLFHAAGRTRGEDPPATRERPI